MPEPMRTLIYDFEEHLRSLPSRPARILRGGKGELREFRQFLSGDKWYSAQGVWKRLVGGRKQRTDAHSSAQTLRQQILDMLGRKCTRCGFADERALQIDHINGGGRKQIRAARSTNQYYKGILSVGGAGYQILCANCNWIKRIENREEPPPRKYQFS